MTNTPAHLTDLVSPCHGATLFVTTRTEGSGHLSTDVPDEINCAADGCYNTWTAKGVADIWNKPGDQATKVRVTEDELEASTDAVERILRENGIDPLVQVADGKWIAEAIVRSIVGVDSADDDSPTIRSLHHKTNDREYGEVEGEAAAKALIEAVEAVPRAPRNA